jgi:hypothetical protein
MYRFLSIITNHLLSSLLQQAAIKQVDPGWNLNQIPEHRVLVIVRFDILTKN